MRVLALILLATPAFATPAFAGPPPLALPLDCRLGETCFIQNYVDDDPGPGAADVGCGTLTYDGHKGTDFALMSEAEMQAGVEVRAAAPGVVRAIRDGMPDLGRDGTPPDQLAGKDCGNGVVIDHGGGWQTQYCHMREGSIAVRKGQRVALGAGLGQVGLSGNTQFPHLHLSVREDGQVVDPFDLGADPACGPGEEMWSAPIAYVPGGLVSVGMARAVPTFAAVKSGAAAHASLTADAPALVGWAQVFGARPGDVLTISLTAPDGSLYYSHDTPLDRAQARAFRAAGKRLTAPHWPEGRWTVTGRLSRDGAVLDEKSAAVALGD